VDDVHVDPQPTETILIKKPLAVVAVLAATGLASVACGSDSSDGSDGTSQTTGVTGSEASGASFNDADVTFAQQMIPHHQQAVQMAEMADVRASSAEVKELAETIQAAQGPEIDTMSGWLESWGEDVPMDMSHGDMGHGVDGPEMPGMMDADQMAALEDAAGAAWDQMFLQMMIEHHEGAIEMAETEVENGENPDAVALADKIISDQQAEITHMQDLLGS
jgi:uncharacterized protein (DUF305 family)